MQYAILAALGTGTLLLIKGIAAVSYTHLELFGDVFAVGEFGIRKDRLDYLPHIRQTAHRLSTPL